MYTNTAAHTKQATPNRSLKKPCWVLGGTVRGVIECRALQRRGLAVSILAHAQCCAHVLFLGLPLNQGARLTASNKMLVQFKIQDVEYIGRKEPETGNKKQKNKKLDEMRERE